MQAIETKYCGLTNTKGSRILAKCDAGKLFMPYDHSLDIEENHKKAATLLRDKLGWTTPYYSRMCGGSLSSGSYVWVFPVDYLTVE